MDRNIGVHCCSKHLHLSLQVWSATSVQFEYVICWQRCAQSRSEFVEGRLLHPTVCSPDLDEADRRKQIIWRGREKKKRIMECFSDERLWILEEVFVLSRGGDMESGQGIITAHGYQLEEILTAH